MAFIEEASDEAAAALYEADRARLGYVANYTRAFARRPAVYEAWQRLSGAIREGMDRRRYELVTLAAARALRSSYCSLAHGKVLAEELLAAAAVRDLAREGSSAALSPAEREAMRFAERIVEDAASITEADVDRLRALGLSDEDVLDVVLAATARCFFSKTLDALGVQADATFAELQPDLRDALTVGRPIEGR